MCSKWKRAVPIGETRRCELEPRAHSALEQIFSGMAFLKNAPPDCSGLKQLETGAFFSLQPQGQYPAFLRKRLSHIAQSCVHIRHRRDCSPVCSNFSQTCSEGPVTWGRFTTFVNCRSRLMPDLIIEQFYLLLLIVPIVFAVGSGAIKWWREASRGTAVSSGETEEGEARVEPVGLFPEGQHYRLRLTNDGTVPARNVHVYVHNKPIPRYRGGASAEPHPFSEVGPGESFSYRYAPGGGEQGDNIIVRTEWKDASGGDVNQTAVRVP